MYDKHEINEAQREIRTKEILRCFYWDSSEQYFKDHWGELILFSTSHSLIYDSTIGEMFWTHVLEIENVIFTLTIKISDTAEFYSLEREYEVEELMEKSRWR